MGGIYEAERRWGAQDFFARFDALRPVELKTGSHPNTRKPRVLGARARREQLRASLRRKEMLWRQPVRPELNSCPDTCLVNQSA